MHELRSGNEWRIMLAYPLAALFLFEFLRMLIHSYSAHRTLVAAAFHAAFVAAGRYSNFWYNEDNAVPPPRARFDLFQLRLVYQSPSNVAVMGEPACLQ